METAGSSEALIPLPGLESDISDKRHHRQGLTSHMHESVSASKMYYM